MSTGRMNEEQIRRHLALDAVKAVLHSAIRDGRLPAALDVDAVVIHPADAQALADVRTLDEHAGQRHLGVPIEVKPNSEIPLRPERAWYAFKPYTPHMWYGATPDEARAKAAAWVREQAQKAGA